MHIRHYLRAIVADKKSSTLLYLSYIWGAVGLVTIYFHVPGSHALIFLSGLFAGMAWMYGFTKGNKYVINKREEIYRP